MIETFYETISFHFFLDLFPFLEVLITLCCYSLLFLTINY